MPNLTNNIDSRSQIWFFPICYHGNINQIMIIIISILLFYMYEIDCRNKYFQVVTLKKCNHTTVVFSNLKPFIMLYCFVLIKLPW